MPRIRTIKPEIHMSRKVGKLSDLAYRLFTGLITLADDEGRIRAHLEEVRAQILPYQPQRKDREFVDAMKELADADLVKWYGDEGEYAWLPGWHEHQKISHPTPSRLPAPPEDSGGFRKFPEQNGASARARADRTLPDLIGKDRIGPEDSLVQVPDLSATSNGCPEEWHQVNEALKGCKILNRHELYDWHWWAQLDKATVHFPDLDPCIEIAKAEAWLVANPRKATARRNYKQFLTNWLHRAAEMKGRYEKGQRS